MSRDEVVYRLAGAGQTSVADLRETIAEAWSDMRHPDTIAHHLVTTAEIDTSIYPRGVNEAVEVSQVKADADGAHVAIAGLLRTMSLDDWKRVWTNVLRPRVHKRFGDHGLSPIESQG